VLTLRPYQQSLIDDIRDQIKAGKKRILVVCPTGGGKTVVSGFIAHNTVRRGGRAFFNVHRDFLLSQTSLTFQRLDIIHSFIASSISKKIDDTVSTQLCSVNTLVKRLGAVTPPTVCIWDETHHIVAGSWKRIFDEFPNAIHIGVTATPQRLDGKGLGDTFEVMVLGPSVSELMDLGNLSRYVAFSIPSEFRREDLHTLGGDFKLDEAEAALDKPKLVGDLVEHYQKHAAGKRAVYFATSIKHSQHIAEAFNAKGIAAKHLDGTHSAEERRQAALDMADGRLLVLTNCALFGEGFDLGAQCGRDDLTIDAVGLARPTQSLSLFLQMVGRALRPKADGSRAVILDHVGNLRDHGFPDDDREWSLEGRKKKQKTTGPRVWDCPQCFAVNLASARFCTECDYERPVTRDAAGRMIDAVDGTLVEMTREEQEEAVAFQSRQEREEKAKKKALWDAVRANDYTTFSRLAAAEGWSSIKIGKSWEFRRQKTLEEGNSYRRYA